MDDTLVPADQSEGAVNLIKKELDERLTEEQRRKQQVYTLLTNTTKVCKAWYRGFNSPESKSTAQGQGLLKAIIFQGSHALSIDITTTTGLQWTTLYSYVIHKLIFCTLACSLHQQVNSDMD